MNTNIKMNTKQLLVVLVFLILVSAVMGILREVFLKEYEEHYHFCILRSYIECMVVVVLCFANKGELLNRCKAKKGTTKYEKTLDSLLRNRGSNNLYSSDSVTR